MPKKKRKFMSGVFIGFTIAIVTWFLSGLFLEPIVQDLTVTTILQIIIIIIFIYVYIKLSSEKSEKKNMSTL